MKEETMRVPQDHQPPRRSRFVAVDHRGRVTALTAEGGDPEPDPALDELAALSDEDRAGVVHWALGVARSHAESWWASQELDTQDLSEGELLEHFLADPTAEALAETPWHAKTTGEHAHSHSAYGSQGSDSTHSHSHSHSGDASHSHHQSTTTTVTPVDGMSLSQKVAQLRERQRAQAPEVERMTVTAVTASGEVEVEMAVRWVPEAVDPFARIGKDGTVPRGAFVSTLPNSQPFAMTAAGADVPQIVDDPGAAWHAILCVEGLRTDEDPGREIMSGACRFPDLPVSLRLQIHDEGGHWGAVTCGRIDAMERLDMQGYGAISGEGIFGTDEHGQTGQLLVTEQTQRFISIDPRDVTMEIIEVEISSTGYYDYDCDDEPDLVDWWVRYTDLVIGAATIVATPALMQAVITLANVELPETPIAVASAQTATITAAGDLSLPPREAFEDPGFHVGDPRLVRQADGHYACPLTVTKDRRVFGHVAYWGANHTGLPGQNRKPPKSPTYAYFMTGARLTAEGEKVAVGNLTMGCGHASTSIRDASAAKAHYGRPAAAHYDGGFGAIQMADVAAGEDDFGIWVAGVICEDVTEADIRRFESLGLSGDWREIAGRLHMVAALAVPVPGFPIAREEALVASAEVIELRSVRAGMDEAGEVYALVAAGRVRAIPPEERLANLEGQLDLLMRERKETIDARLRLEAHAALAGLLDVEDPELVDA
jgi:hypothetical protein